MSIHNTGNNIINNNQPISSYSMILLVFNHVTCIFPFTFTNPGPITNLCGSEFMFNIIKLKIQSCNRPVFFDPQGKKRSFFQVCTNFTFFIQNVNSLGGRESWTSQLIIPFTSICQLSNLVKIWILYVVDTGTQHAGMDKNGYR